MASRRKIIDGVPYCVNGHPCTPENVSGYNCLPCRRASSRRLGMAKRRADAAGEGRRLGQRRVEPMTMARLLRSAHVSSASGCWVWTKSLERSGYGHTGVNGKTTKVHRLAWELTNGPIPPGMFVCHHCDNPACFRVSADPAESHLFLGTHQDNMQDMLAKGRGRWAGKTHCAKGHPYSGDNLVIYPQRPGHRQCRACQRERSRAYYVTHAKAKYAKAQARRRARKAAGR